MILLALLVVLLLHVTRTRYPLMPGRSGIVLGGFLIRGKGKLWVSWLIPLEEWCELGIQSGKWLFRWELELRGR